MSSWASAPSASTRPLVSCCSRHLLRLLPASMSTIMPTEAAPSPTMTLPRMRPCMTSEGAVRQYRPLSSHVLKSGEVLAGDIISVPSPVIWLITVLVTPEDAAPMIADTFCPSISVLDWVAMFVVVSPESRCMVVTSLPFTPPAALISLTARSTPAVIGGPKNDRPPVLGNRVPSFRTPSPAAAGESDAPGDSLLELLPPPPQAVTARAIAAPIAKNLALRVKRDRASATMLALLKNMPSRNCPWGRPEFPGLLGT